ncbi:ParA family protein [Pseudomonas aeruginosa]|uniref:ParA family protein n=1 Tax=Pseudomonas aeruginosa TaxID=287 RepID=UPI000941794B|nr:AAA family ATPase [Pseudomonas aeruginosa]ELK4905455.1 AAA family ATPase [Pseudomonas aeruginosa]MBG6610696.1 AAA family ATPase [Pseudomonas aeruginosa]RTX36651.1 ParA family protein [Pseudomonas aeruginosa]HCE6083091.1 AAA family ATPase [Pseudomonas aeruginosa]HEJ1301332.1 AAA family ATPase [Pseudomonas aeruginosa]
MISIGFFNNKGGVGKTTLLCNIAAALAKDHKILVIDGDPQCNASAYLLPEIDLDEILLNKSDGNIDSFYEPIRKGKGYPQKIPDVARSERFNLDVIPGDPNLSLREDLLAQDWAATRNGEPRGFQTTFAIRELIGRFDKYDYVLVDMGPSLGALNRSILLGVDYFIMPLSVDIFSLMAIANILQSFKTWQEDLGDAIQRHIRQEKEEFIVGGQAVAWKLKFAGYVMQQYHAKTREGERRAVVAYDKIIQAQKTEVVELCKHFDVEPEEAVLGEVPALHSLVPLSQQAHAPISDLGSRDGIVGSHYQRVAEATKIFNEISAKLVRGVSK